MIGILYVYMVYLYSILWALASQNCVGRQSMETMNTQYVYNICDTYDIYGICACELMSTSLAGIFCEKDSDELSRLYMWSYEH